VPDMELTTHKIFQTLFGNRNGNCQAACLATLLGVALDDVPHFCRDVPKGQDWVMAQNKWLAAKHGLVMVSFRLKPNGGLPSINALADGIPCLISGKSPRGKFNHSVVGLYRLKDGMHQLDYVHDPHPDGTFLEKAKSVDFFITCRPGMGGR